MSDPTKKLDMLVRCLSTAIAAGNPATRAELRGMLIGVGLEPVDVEDVDAEGLRVIRHALDPASEEDMARCRELECGPDAWVAECPLHGNPQQAALLELEAVQCKIDPKGCDGQWCTARAKVLEAFGLNQEESHDD